MTINKAEAPDDFQQSTGTFRLSYVFVYLLMEGLKTG
ncbi:hypothetical protein T03_15407 [Trichinella britovi]|uniref:Uncharacterized protein n=1 Tax=Trichinella britovi TaxID=45882 RepID=A0A0V1AM66_TRIBR|nr:hypothetical protein T03_15407 [Trichinella britovi]